MNKRRVIGRSMFCGLGHHLVSITEDQAIILDWEGNKETTVQRGHPRLQIWQEDYFKEPVTVERAVKIWALIGAPEKGCEACKRTADTTMQLWESCSKCGEEPIHL
jgi:hypothetical protein